MSDWGDWIERIPEWELVKAGDPFMSEIVKGDDIIDDYRYNHEWFGLTAAQAAPTVLWAKWAQLDYELELLERWIRL